MNRCRSIGLFAALIVLTSSTPIFGQVFQYPEDSRPTSLIPFFADDMSSVRMSELIFDSLVKENKRGDIVGSLAVDWKAEPGNMGIRFTLRDGVKWHDGQPFTAADVVFTVQAAKDKGTQFTGKGKFSFISRVRAEGRQTVVFSFKSAIDEPAGRFKFKILPRHHFNGTAISRRDRFSRKPIGTGPYRLARFSLRKIELDANQDHWEPPGIGRVVMQHTPDKAIQVNLLQYSGGKAGVQAVIFLPPKNIPLFENDETVVLEPYHTVSWWYLAFNHASPGLGDRKVREAIAFALDREVLLSSNLGRGDILSGPFTESSPFYDFDVEVRESDLERAGQLLDEAGYRMSGGVRSKKGTKLSFTMALDKELVEHQEIFLAIQARLKRVGIKLEPTYLDHAAYKETVWKRKKYDLTINVWSFEEVENVRPLFHSKGAYNFINYANSEVDQILDAAAKSTNYKEHKKHMKSLHPVVNKDLPYLFLWSLDVYSGISKRVKNVYVAPYYYFTTFSEWELGR